MTSAIVLLVAIALIIVAWAAARLLRAMRLGRRGFDIGSEDRRLREDPRFLEIQAQQYRRELPPDQGKSPPADA